MVYSIWYFVGYVCGTVTLQLSDDLTGVHRDNRHVTFCSGTVKTYCTSVSLQRKYVKSSSLLSYLVHLSKISNCSGQVLFNVSLKGCSIKMPQNIATPLHKS